MSILDNFDGIIRPLFIETGTGQGNTLILAAKVFPECISVEYNPEHVIFAKKRLDGQANVKIETGNSPEILPRIIRSDVPTTFWLDAHYQGTGDSATPYGQCPLRRELEIIASRPWKVKPIVIIDDAHMFDDSIPHPGFKNPFWFSNDSNHDIYRRQDWPRINEMDDIMAGYRRSMFSEFIIRYDGVEA